MAAGGAARVVGEKKGQCAGYSAPAGGRWKAAATTAGSASDDASSCGMEDLHVLEMDPAHADANSRQLVVATTAPMKQRTEPAAASPVALDIAASARVSAGATSSGNNAREKRVVDANGVPEASEMSHEADGAGAVGGGAVASSDPAQLAATNADATGGDGCENQSDAEADADHPTDGSCSTDVSTATTVASGDKGTPAASTRKRRRASTSLTHQYIDELLRGLTARAEEKRAYLVQQEAIYACGRERVAQLEREFKELTAAVDRCLAKKREHRRIERLMRGRRRERHSDDDDSGNESSSSSSSSSSDSSSSRSPGERRKRRRTSSRSVDRNENKDTTNSSTSIANGDSGVTRVSDQRDNGGDEQRNHQHERKRRRPRRKKKEISAQRERKRLRRFRDDLALRFQLLQSECRRSELQVDKLVADLRREYMDSYLFAGAEFP